MCGACGKALHAHKPLRGCVGELRPHKCELWVHTYAAGVGVRPFTRSSGLCILCFHTSEHPSLNFEMCPSHTQEPAIPPHCLEHCLSFPSHPHTDLPCLHQSVKSQSEGGSHGTGETSKKDAVFKADLLYPMSGTRAEGVGTLETQAPAFDSCP